MSSLHGVLNCLSFLHLSQSRDSLTETLACNHLYTDIDYVDLTRTRNAIRTILFYVRLQKKQLCQDMSMQTARRKTFIKLSNQKNQQ